MGQSILEHDHKKDHIVPAMKEQALAARTVKNLPAKKTIKYYCVFIISISIISIINHYLLCSGSPAPQMSITFACKADILLWAFAK